MLNILVLILVAITITAVTSKLQEVINLASNAIIKRDIKSGLIVATLLGIVAGVALQIGIVSSVAELFGGLPELPVVFDKVDIGLSCVGLSAGSGFFIKIYEQFKTDSESFVE